MLETSIPVITPAMKNGKWDNRTWVLVEKWELVFETDRYRLKVVILPGFETDGGSIPSICQNILNPLGKFLRDYLAHDGIYATESLPRATADWLFLELLQEDGANWFIRNSMWSAVRIGGSAVWKQHTPESIAEARKLVTVEYTKF